MKPRNRREKRKYVDFKTSRRFENNDLLTFCQPLQSFADFLPRGTVGHESSYSHLFLPALERSEKATKDSTSSRGRETCRLPSPQKSPQSRPRSGSRPQTFERSFLPPSESSKRQRESPTSQGERRVKCARNRKTCGLVEEGD